MKKIFKLKLFCILILFSCERGSRGGKYEKKIYGNVNKTSQFGGCAFKDECWDYKGIQYKLDFESNQLQLKCQQDSGQFVMNGCDDKNKLLSCSINSKTDLEILLHFYNQDNISLNDAIELCTSQGGEVL